MSYVTSNIFFLKLTDALKINKVLGERTVSKKAVLGFNIDREPAVLHVLEEA